MITKFQIRRLLSIAAVLFLACMMAHVVWMRHNDRRSAS